MPDISFQRPTTEDDEVQRLYNSGGRMIFVKPCGRYGSINTHRENAFHRRTSNSPAIAWSSNIGCNGLEKEMVSIRFSKTVSHYSAHFAAFTIPTLHPLTVLLVLLHTIRWISWCLMYFYTCTLIVTNYYFMHLALLHQVSMSPSRRRRCS